MFRAAILRAYGIDCTITGLPAPRLLDAAHNVEDKDEKLGERIFRSGLPLSEIHHAAFDADLIGIDPDHTIHLSTELLEEDDGSMLDLSQGLHRQDDQSAQARARLSKPSPLRPFPSLLLPQLYDKQLTTGRYQRR